MVELVGGKKSAVVDERWVGRGLAGFAVPHRTHLNIGGVGLVRCTPAMSVSSVVSES